MARPPTWPSRASLTPRWAPSWASCWRWRSPQWTSASTWPDTTARATDLPCRSREHGHRARNIGQIGLWRPTIKRQKLFFNSKRRPQGRRLHLRPRQEAARHTTAVRLLLHGLDLGHDAHVLGEAIFPAVVHAEGRTVDGGFEITAAHFALEHGAVVAGELVGLEGHGLGLALDGQVAGNGRQLVAIERELVAHELRRGELGRVKDLGTLQVLVERRSE